MISDESFFILFLSQWRDKKTETILSKFLQDILGGGIIIGDNQNGFIRCQKVCDNVENRLCLTGSRRTLNDAYLIGECFFYSTFLTCIATKREKEAVNLALFYTMLWVEVNRSGSIFIHKIYF